MQLKPAGGRELRSELYSATCGRLRFRIHWGTAMLAPETPSPRPHISAHNTPPARCCSPLWQEATPARLLPAATPPTTHPKEHNIEPDSPHSPAGRARTGQQGGDFLQGYSAAHRVSGERHAGAQGLDEAQHGAALRVCSFCIGSSLQEGIHC